MLEFELQRIVGVLLEKKIDEGIFLEYSMNRSAYQAFNLRTKNVIESINVIVDDYNDAFEQFTNVEILSLVKERNNQVSQGYESRKNQPHEKQ